MVEALGVVHPPVVVAEASGNTCLIHLDFFLARLVFSVFRFAMITLDWMTELIWRTIGAARGRAARGSPSL